jgi:hypothetical protein
MLRLTTNVVSWALIMSCLVFDAAYAQTKPSDKVNTGTVSGRVTVKGKGVRGIAVGLRAGELYQRATSTLKAITDEDGKYRLTGVPAGTCQLAPIAPAFVVVDNNNSPLHSGLGGKTLLIAEGEVVEGLDFALVRGGVITGRVTDEQGRPVIEESVQLLPENQSTSLPPGVGNVVTDDRGIYRSFGLPSGQYRVAAGRSNDGPFGGRGRRPAYRRTFHPSANDSAQAKVIEIAEGTEATNIDITLGAGVTGVSASGRVVDSKTGEPIANVRLNLTQIIVQGNSRGSSGGNIQSSDVKGQFRVEGLQPGKYVVSLSPSQENRRADPVTFDVLDQDVTGLLLKTSVGGTLAGTVVFEGLSQNSASQKFGGLFISASAPDEPNLGGWSSTQSPVGPDGRFFLVGLRAGTIQLSLAEAGDSSGRAVVLTRIERDGVVQPDGLQIQAGEQVSGVRLIATKATGSMRGKIKIENGPLPSDAHLFINLVKLGDPSNMISASVDVRGYFVADRLFPGIYEVTATVYSSRSHKNASSGKQLVTVTEGTASEVTITLDLAHDPNRIP